MFISFLPSWNLHKWGCVCLSTVTLCSDLHALERLNHIASLQNGLEFIARLLNSVLGVLAQFFNSSAVHKTIVIIRVCAILIAFDNHSSREVRCYYYSHFTDGQDSRKLSRLSQVTRHQFRIQTSILWFQVDHPCQCMTQHSTHIKPKGTCGY